MTGIDVILAGASARSLAESAIRDGLRPLCVDMFNDADLADTLMRLPPCSGSRLRQIRRFSELPAVVGDVPKHVPLVWSGGLENHTSVLEQLVAQRPVAGADVDSIRRLRCPDQLFGQLSDAGFCVPRWSHSPPADRSSAWLCKPLTSAGGLGIYEVSATDGTGNDVDSATKSDRQSGVYFQQKLSGISLSATFQSARQHSGGLAGEPPAADDVSLLGISLILNGRAEFGAPPYAFCGNVGPLRVRSTLQQQLLSIGRFLATTFHVRGIFGVDAIVVDDRVFVLEVNPRITAVHDLYEVTGITRPGHVVCQLATVSDNRISALRNPSTTSAPQDSAVGPIARFIVYAVQRFRVSPQASCELLTFNALQNREQGKDFIRIADVPTAGTEILPGQPVCSLYVGLPASEDSLQAVERAGQSLLPDVRAAVLQSSATLLTVTQALQQEEYMRTGE